jgi:hypothetical protein
MSENMTEKVRKDIMKNFLRTLVWIDDEIRPEKTDHLGDPFRSLFYPIAQEFQKQNLLVHLCSYDADTRNEGGNMFDETATKSFESAVSLAKKADVIILDWHLGADDPKNSILLLKSLEKESAIRYIIVLSEYDGDFETDMKKNGMLVSASVKFTESHLYQRKGGAWANSQGTHIIVMKKPDLGSASASVFSHSVINSIYDLMSKANPDYLHWAAIEIAAKVRHSIPGWIQAIPCGTDAAVLSELISDDSEACDFIPEHLLEDLSHLAKLHSLLSLDSENCEPSHWQNKTYDSEALPTNSERYKKFVHFSLASSDLDKKSVDTIRKKSLEEDPCKLFLKSQQSFTSFCENLSGTTESFPTFGSVYVLEPKEDDNADSSNIDEGEFHIIYVCLSQECDSVRSNSLILLKGSVASGSSTKENITKLALQDKVFGFLPEAQSIKSVDVDLGDEGSIRQLTQFKKIGQLRKATARRILSRFWNHVSRSAVNLSRFTLKDRDGE